MNTSDSKVNESNSSSSKQSINATNEEISQTETTTLTTTSTIGTNPASENEENAELNKEREEFLKLLKQMNIKAPGAPTVPRKKTSEKKEYKFWKTQPVPSLNEECEEHGPIDDVKTVDQVRQEPYNMPPGFEWCEIDLKNSIEAKEVYDLLTENYVEDDDNMFRFDYSVDFLSWALTPPGYYKSWHIGVRNQKTGKLMAFISGVPSDIRSYESTMPMAEINFLCVHKKLRTKRLAPVLIKEVTRRVNLQNIWQAVYTAGVVLPKPVGQCRYYHRSLNPKKLIDVGFSSLAPRMTMNRTIKLYRLPEKPLIPGFRPMEEKDIPQIFSLLVEYLKKYKLAPVFQTHEEIKHWFFPREGVIDAYVVENPSTRKITDFCSFYHLPSTIIGNPNYSILKAAYSFYNVATSIPLTELINDCLIMAKSKKFDVFNALNLMDNNEFLEKLKFGKGDGELQYYLYNWKCPMIQSNEVGIVLC